MVSRRAEILLAGALAGLLALALHAPLLGALGGGLPGEAGSDVFRAHWSLWMVADAMPGWPYSSAQIAFPEGVDWLPFPAISLVLWAPVTALLGPDLALPFLILTHAAAAFLGAWWLARVLGAGLGGAAVAGALLATQPALGGALRDGTLEILAAGWLPVSLGALVLACRGQLRWAAPAGLLYLAMCLESVYYGSFGALASLAALSTIRSRRGLLGAALAGVTVAAGAGLIYLIFEPLFAQMGEALAQTGDDTAAVRAQNAAKLDDLKALALAPGSRGWMVGFLYAPPLAHWIAFAIGGLLALRRGAWLVVLGGLYLALGLDHGAVSWWSGSPLGEPVRFLRRYLIPVGFALGAAAAVGLAPLVRWRPRGLPAGAVELAIGLAAAAWLALWGAHGGGWVNGYPLVELPEVAFAAPLAEDDEDCAALFLPLEVPGSASQNRNEAPVFASVGDEIASADLLFLQTRTQKAIWQAPSLITLRERPSANQRVAKNLSDLSFASVGQSVPGSAKLPASDYEDELAWLLGAGLKYVVVDEARFLDEHGAFLESILSGWAVERTRYDDGTGIAVYRLYDERPPAAPTPEIGDPSIGSGTEFSGTISGMEALDGAAGARLKVKVGDEMRYCEIGPVDHSFHCQGVYSVDVSWVEIDGALWQTSWVNRQLSDAQLVVGRPL